MSIQLLGCSQAVGGLPTHLRRAAPASAGLRLAWQPATTSASHSRAPPRVMSPEVLYSIAVGCNQDGAPKRATTRCLACVARLGTLVLASPDHTDSCMRIPHALVASSHSLALCGKSRGHCSCQTDKESALCHSDMVSGMACAVWSTSVDGLCCATQGSHHPRSEVGQSLHEQLELVDDNKPALKDLDSRHHLQMRHCNVLPLEHLQCYQQCCAVRGCSPRRRLPRCCCLCHLLLGTCSQLWEDNKSRGAPAQYEGSRGRRTGRAP